MEECKPVKTPVVMKQDLGDFKQSEKVDMKNYQKMTGKLMYLAIGTRPDIAQIVSKLSQYNSDPRLISPHRSKTSDSLFKGNKRPTTGVPKREHKFFASGE